MMEEDRLAKRHCKEWVKTAWWRGVKTRTSSQGSESQSSGDQGGRGASKGAGGKSRWIMWP